jgi:hypothetical protein
MFITLAKERVVSFKLCPLQRKAWHLGKGPWRNASNLHFVFLDLKMLKLSQLNVSQKVFSVLNYKTYSEYHDPR